MFLYDLPCRYYLPNDESLISSKEIPLRTCRILEYFAGMLICSIIQWACIGCNSENINDIPTIEDNFINLTQKDTTWKVEEDHRSKSDNGLIKLKRDRWLMYFLHWRPIDETNNDLTIDYVKHLTQTLWGPQMPIKLKGNQGETIVNGHQAYFIDASFGNGRIQTRMIVWNCPETKRQFISDCNINITAGTPQKFFNIQTDEITPSICCHGENPNSNVIFNQHIQKKFYSEKLKLSFNVPNTWKTTEFRFDTEKVPEYLIPGYYPGGIKKQRGSLLTLLTDSERDITVKWYPNKDKEKISESLMRKYLNHLNVDSTIEMRDTLKLCWKKKNVSIGNIININHMFYADGKYEYGYHIINTKRADSDPYVYKAFLVERDNKIYFILASMAAYDNIWGVPVDLTPSEKQFSEFINNEVLKNLLN